MRHFRPEKWVKDHFIAIFIGLAFVSVLTQSIGLLFQTPYESQIEAVKFAVEKADGRLLDNDWSYGYWIMFFGGKTVTYGGGWPDYTESWNDPILLTENTKPNSDCKLIKTWVQGGFYKADIQVYAC